MSTEAAQIRTLDSGISGRVFLHNPFVVSRDGQSGVTTPFSASFRVYRVGSPRLLTRVTTDSPGRLRLSLSPGYYRLVPETMAGGRVLLPGDIVIGGSQSARPVTVRVRAHRFTPVVITYEQGMGF